MRALYPLLKRYLNINKMQIHPLKDQPQKVKDAYQEYLDSLSQYSIYEMMFFEWAIFEIKGQTQLSKLILYKTL